jgi:PII-like signaling protein
MKNTHRIEAQETGKIRIYLTPRDRVAARGFLNRLGARPVYREIVSAAKKDGLHSAVAFTAHHGFSNGGQIKSENIEAPNSGLTICVELIDHKDRLEEFCRHHGDLLKGRSIVYKHVEHWSLHEHDLTEQDASPDEVIDGDKEHMKRTH